MSVHQRPKTKDESSPIDDTCMIPKAKSQTQSRSCRLLAAAIVFSSCIGMAYQAGARSWSEPQSISDEIVPPNVADTFVGRANQALANRNAESAIVLEPLKDRLSPERATVSISTDKPKFRPTETVHVTAWLLDAHTRRPWCAEGCDQSQNSARGRYVLEILGPKEDVAHSQTTDVMAHSSSVQPTLSFTWSIPASAVGGEYTILFKEDEFAMQRRTPSSSINLPRFAPARRKFTVVHARQKSIRTTVEFGKEGYGPNEDLEATLVALQPNGSPLGPKARVDVTVRVEGTQVFEARDLSLTDASALRIKAPLKAPEHLLQTPRSPGVPPTWKAGISGTLSARVRDGGGAVDTASRQVPLASPSNVNIETFAEGGEMVAGVETRVYVECRFDNGEPADVGADLVEVTLSDCNGQQQQQQSLALELEAEGAAQVVASVSTQHEGRGVSTLFTPKPQTTTGKGECTVYALRLKGSLAGSPLKALSQTVVEYGVAIRPAAIWSLFSTKTETSDTDTTPPACFQGKEPMEFILQSSEKGDFDVVVSLKEIDVAAERVTLNAFEEKRVAIEFDQDRMSKVSSDGVFRLTVYNAQSGNALSERLIWREPSRVLRFGVRVNNETIQALVEQEKGSKLLSAVSGGAVTVLPGGSIDLEVVTEPHSFVSLTVVDSRVRESLPARRRPPSLPTMAYFEHEVNELTDSDAFDINAANDDQLFAERMVKIDLLLGTQGWRRFAWTDPVSFLENGVSPRDPKTVLKDPKRAKEAAQSVFGVGNKDKPPMLKMKRARGGGGGDGFAEPAMMMMMAAGSPPMAEMMAEMADAPVAAFAMNEEPQGAAMAMVEGPGIGEAVFGMEEEEDEDEYEEDAYGANENNGGNNIKNGDVNIGLAPPPMLEAPLMMKRVAHALPRPDMAQAMAPPIPQQRNVPLREYRHIASPPRSSSHDGGKDRTRSDFSETVFWSSCAKADQRGVAKFQFDASDSETTFALHVDGATAGGVLGGSRIDIVSTAQPLFLDSKLPAAAVVGDSINLPVSVRLSPKKDGLTLRGGAQPLLSVAVKLTSSNGLIMGEAREDSSPPGQKVTKVGETAAKLEVSSLKQGSSARVLVPLLASSSALSRDGPSGGKQPLVHLSATATNAASVVVATDSSERGMEIVAGGFPLSVSRGGVLGNHAGKVDDAASLALTVPFDRVEGSTSLLARIYVSPAASLSAALETLLREPCGCFEQTSATTYPIVLALSYFLSKGERPGSSERVDKARTLLSKGYKKLASFQTQSGGFEWFGQEPAHEALTSYGVLQFFDMQRAYPGLVSSDMLKRATDWLLNRRSGREPLSSSRRRLTPSSDEVPESSAFMRSKQALDGFGRAPTLTTDAYIIYALCRAGFGDQLQPELSALVARATATDGCDDDPYVLALAAGALLRAGDSSKRGQAWTLNRRAAAKQQLPGGNSGGGSGDISGGKKDSSSSDPLNDGRVEGAVSSITSSSGDSLAVEATAVCVLAWIDDEMSDDKKMDDFEVATARGSSSSSSSGDAGGAATTSLAVNIEAAARWLSSRCQGGRFGSTQATVLALHAIVAYDGWRAGSVPPGTASLIVDGVVVAKARVDSKPPLTPLSTSHPSRKSVKPTASGKSSKAAEDAATADGSSNHDGALLLHSEHADRAISVPGDHTVQLSFTPDKDHATAPSSSSYVSSFSLPYSIDAGWATSFPDSSRSCAVALSTSLSAATLREGEAGELTVTLTVLSPPLDRESGHSNENPKATVAVAAVAAVVAGAGMDGQLPPSLEEEQGVPMVVAVVGLPGGLEVDEEQLRLVQKSGVVDFVERLGAAEVALYWRSLPYFDSASGSSPKGGQQKKKKTTQRVVRLPFTAAVPGSFTGRASRAYLYYTDERKSWAEPLVVRVEPA